MIAFVLFIIVHISMVIVERFPDNMGNIFLGKGTSLGVAIGIFGLFVLAIIAIHVWATGISLKSPRYVQNKLGAIIEHY
jgi:sulfoxide reductase catalytic subunit YedY